MRHNTYCGVEIHLTLLPHRNRRKTLKNVLETNIIISDVY